MKDLIKSEDIDIAMKNDSFRYVAEFEYESTTYEVLGDISDIERSVITPDECDRLADPATDRRLIEACDKAARLWLAEVLTEGLSCTIVDCA